ncbi:hypothetical protein TNCV_1797431 [Trichonephila clavipes]|nr:hypothetical protein TNCV_1797431 [Trichonephila clavipes]
MRIRNSSKSRGDTPSLSKTEETPKETLIEYFYRMQEIASQIKLDEEAETFYLIKGGRPCIQETNESHSNDQRICDWMLQLSTSVKEPKKITWYSNHIGHENL